MTTERTKQIEAMDRLRAVWFEYFAALDRKGQAATADDTWTLIEISAGVRQGGPVSLEKIEALIQAVERQKENLER